MPTQERVHETSLAYVPPVTLIADWIQSACGVKRQATGDGSGLGQAEGEVQILKPELPQLMLLLLPSEDQLRASVISPTGPGQLVAQYFSPLTVSTSPEHMSSVMVMGS